MMVEDWPIIESPVPLPHGAVLRGADKVYCISFPEHDLHVDFRCEDAQRDGILASAITDMLAAIRSTKPETGAPMSNKWTIQLRYTDRGDDGEMRNVQSAYQTEARSLPEAYANARAAFQGRNVRFGAIIPGHHMLVP